MKGFTFGLLAGGIIGMAGVSYYALSDKHTRKRLMRDTKRMANKTGDLVANLTDIF